MAEYYVVRQRDGFPKEYMTAIVGAWTENKADAVKASLDDGVSLEPTEPEQAPEGRPRWKGPVVIKYNGGHSRPYIADVPKGATNDMTADLYLARVFNHVNHARNSLAKRGLTSWAWEALPVRVSVGNVAETKYLVPGYQPITLFPKSR